MFRQAGNVLNECDLLNTVHGAIVIAGPGAGKTTAAMRALRDFLKNQASARALYVAYNAGHVQEDLVNRWHKIVENDNNEDLFDKLTISTAHAIGRRVLIRFRQNMWRTSDYERIARSSVLTSDNQSFNEAGHLWSTVATLFHRTTQVSVDFRDPKVQEWTASVIRLGFTSGINWWRFATLREDHSLDLCYDALSLGFDLKRILDTLQNDNQAWADISQAVPPESLLQKLQSTNTAPQGDDSLKKAYLNLALLTCYLQSAWHKDYMSFDEMIWALRSSVHAYHLVKQPSNPHTLSVADQRLAEALNQEILERYQAIVVDEVQDFSAPICHTFGLLSFYIKRFIIMGDVAQSINRQSARYHAFVSAINGLWAGSNYDISKLPENTILLCSNQSYRCSTKVATLASAIGEHMQSMERSQVINAASAGSFPDTILVKDLFEQAAHSSNSQQVFEEAVRVFSQRACTIVSAQQHPGAVVYQQSASLAPQYRKTSHGDAQSDLVNMAANWINDLVRKAKQQQTQGENSLYTVQVICMEDSMIPHIWSKLVMARIPCDSEYNVILDKLMKSPLLIPFNIYRYIQRFERNRQQHDIGADQVVPFMLHCLYQIMRFSPPREWFKSLADGLSEDMFAQLVEDACNRLAVAVGEYMGEPTTPPSFHAQHPSTCVQLMEHIIDVFRNCIDSIKSEDEANNYQYKQSDLLAQSLEVLTQAFDKGRQLAHGDPSHAVPNHDHASSHIGMLSAPDQRAGVHRSASDLLNEWIGALNQTATAPAVQRIKQHLDRVAAIFNNNLHKVNIDYVLDRLYQLSEYMSSPLASPLRVHVLNATSQVKGTECDIAIVVMPVKDNARSGNYEHPLHFMGTLYVACTRPRGGLVILGTNPFSSYPWARTGQLNSCVHIVNGGSFLPPGMKGFMTSPQPPFNSCNSGDNHGYWSQMFPPASI